MSRRTMLSGVIGVAGLLTFSDLELFAMRAQADAPWSADAVIALARGQEAKTISGLQETVWSYSPYSTYAGEWCAVFISWLLQYNGVPYNTYVPDMRSTLPVQSTPIPGAVKFYGTSHVGLVTAVNGGSHSTIEGNTPGVHWSISRVTDYPNAYPYSGTVTYGYPTYGSGGPGSPPTQQGADYEMTDLIYYATAGTTYTTNGVKTPAVAVAANSLWYQERPGAPLFRITDNYNSSNMGYQGNLEYAGFAGARFSNTLAARTPATPTDIGKLIELRGETLQPAASLAPLRTV